jgi:adenine phosphoribosyltransferase
MDFAARVETLKASIRDVPDFPKKGIVFKDITTLLRDPRAYRQALDLFIVLCDDLEIDKVVAIESRGFLFGSAVADRLSIGLVPVRKVGKLPAKTVRASYDLEYGTDTVEMHADALEPGERVLVVDDVVATGGTAAAVGQLVESVGAKVAAFGFLIELSFLNGRAKLGTREVRSLITY